MAPKCNALFYFYHEALGGEVFLDSDAEFINIVHENDGSWRNYFDFVVERFGGQIIEIDVRDLIDEIPEEEFEKVQDLDFKDLAKAIVKLVKSEIKTAIEEAQDV